MRAEFVEGFEKSAAKINLFSGVKKPHIGSSQLTQHFNNPATFASASKAAKQTNKMMAESVTPAKAMAPKNVSVPLPENHRQAEIRKKMFSNAQPQV